SSSSGTNSKEGMPLTVTTTGSFRHNRAYRLKLVLASLSGTTFMMFLELLSLNQQCVSFLLTNRSDNDCVGLFIHVEQDSISSQKPKFAGRERVRPKCFEVAAHLHRILCKHFGSFLKDRSPFFAAEPTQVIEH